jgi:Arc/MetJ-type ribon-helix-helix transcriptional regulator
MSTHRVVVELPIESYEQLRRLVTLGGYASESAAIADALLDHSLAERMREIDPSAELIPALREEFCTAYDEDVANPEAALSSSELDTYLARERVQLRKAG